MDTDLTDLFVEGGSDEKFGGDPIDANKPATKDAIVSKLMPNVISECASYLGQTDHCMSDDTAHAVAKIVHSSKTSAVEIIAEAEQKLGCDTERCVLEKLTPQLGEARVRGEIKSKFKVKGPTDTKLLSNVHIDSILHQWRIMFPDFFPYNFNMLNYASYSYSNGYSVNEPDSLATIAFADLYNGEFDGTKYKCCGCVINSDTYQGPGKHWMALFADTRGPQWTVEFFNSSGQAPAPEWINWMEKTKNAMAAILEADGPTSKKPPEIVRVTSICHQKSRTECGLYSLFYIWARLNGVSPTYFTTNRIADQLMFEFRHHLFDDRSRPKMKSFDWVTYIKNTKIQWEK